MLQNLNYKGLMKSGKYLEKKLPQSVKVSLLKSLRVRLYHLGNYKITGKALLPDNGKIGNGNH